MASGGGLSPVAGSPFPQLNNSTLDIPCSGNYVVSLQLNPAFFNLSSGVYVDQIGAGGVLAPALGLSTFPLPSTGPGVMAISSDDRFLYVSSNNPFGVIVLDESSGTLTPISGSPFHFSGAENSSPVAMGISGDGKFSCM